MALVHSEMQLTTTSSRPAARTATPLEQRDVTQLPFPTATVCGHLLWRLYQLGVDHIFGVPGDFALGMFELLQRSPIKYIGTCNELNAGYAADGYARVKGIGACMFTYAVGELSALNAVAGALSERIPMVVIVGVPPTSGTYLLCIVYSAQPIRLSGLASVRGQGTPPPHHGQLQHPARHLLQGDLCPGPHHRAVHGGRAD